ncbi:NAD(P)H-hydrate dehydratase [Alphaproteobacteria bacterium]|nr:NAD(P)H-hydrate dehydratase [Alphaproteobacteria bacterium]
MNIINKSDSYILANKISTISIESSFKNSFNLMQKAGKLAAKNINSLYSKRKTLILCGVGGNGGDGFIIAQELFNKGWDIKVSIIGNQNKIKGDSLKALNKLKLKPLSFSEIKLDKSKLFIDAIYGIGLSRKVNKKECAILNTLDKHPAPIIAIDIPSGIDCNNGKILGFAAYCDLTITFSTLKTGHILLPGSEKINKIKVLDIGISKDIINKIEPNVKINNINEWVKEIVWPKIDDHKYSRGYSLIIGGPKNMTGASRLAAMAAQRAGSGIVALATEKAAAEIYFISLTSQLVKTYKNIKEYNTIINEPRIDSIVIGPGLDVSNKSILKIKSTLKTNKRIVLDAGAISCFKNKLEVLVKILSGKDVIITPHEGELKSILPNLSGSLISKALKTAKILNTIVVLKGATTVIASPNNKAFVNTAGAKWLATAGSGDVLAGIIGGLLSNKMKTFYAAAYGVWLHSEAGKYLGPGLIAEDINKILPKILKNI